nr:immunoglobulin heavy chain junction region [Mus musculus]
CAKVYGSSFDYW